MRCCSTEIWPARLVRRIANCFVSASRIAATCASLRRRTISAGKTISAASSAFCEEPRLLCAVGIELLRQHRHGGPLLRVVKHDHGLGLDPVAFAHPQLADDAAIEMLDRLAVAVDLDDGWRDDGAVERRVRRPSRRARRRTAASRQDPSGSAGRCRLATRPRARDRRSSVRSWPQTPDAWRAARSLASEATGAGTGWPSLAGPRPCACNSRTMPVCIITILSTLLSVAGRCEMTITVQPISLSFERPAPSARSPSMSRLELGSVEHDEGRVAIERARQADALTVAARQVAATLLDQRVIAPAAIRGSARAHRPAWRPRRPSSSSPVPKRAMLAATVSANSFDFLWQIADMAAEIGAAPGRYIDAVEPDPRPPVGAWMPTIRRARVDLPAPLGPMMPSVSPGSISKLMSRSTGRCSPRQKHARALCTELALRARQPQVRRQGRKRGEQAVEPAIGGACSDQLAPPADCLVNRLQRPAPAGTSRRT